jgi:hypothetical protein
LKKNVLSNFDKNSKMKKPQSSKVNILLPKAEQRKQRWKQVGFILGVLGSLATIWQVFVPNLFKRESKQTVEVILPVDTLHKPTENPPVSVQPPLKSVKSELVTNKIKQQNKKGNNEANQNSGTNQGNIGGSNNTVVNKVHQVGRDNYGINGDAYFTTDRQFTDQDATSLTSLIQRLEANNNKKYDSFLITLYNGTPNNLFVAQMKKFLAARGYRFYGYQMANGIGLEENFIKLSDNGDAFTMDVCLLDPEQPVNY